MQKLCLVVALVWMLTGCSSGSTDAIATEPVPAASAPTTATTATTAPLAPTTPPDPPQPTVVPTSLPADDILIELWFPTQAVGGDGDSINSVERLVPFEVDDPTVDRLSTILDMWLVGPTSDETGGVSLSPSAQFAGCDDPLDAEVIDGAALVGLCLDSADSPGALANSLARTLVSAQMFADFGIVDAEDGRCIRAGYEDYPLGCVPIEFRQDEGYTCPVGLQTKSAVVTGVEEWVNARLGPSIDADKVARLYLDSFVSVYPSSLTNDGTGRSWVMVQLPYARERCASVAAEFLTGTLGNLADIVPGVSFELPATGSWTLAQRESVFDRTTWRLDGSFGTDVSFHILDGNQIDSQLASWLAVFERGDYDYPEDWFVEVKVEGAERAVRPVYIISGSGDVGSQQLLIEVGSFTIVASTGVYIEDGDRVVFEELEAFLASIRVDREELIGALTVEGETQATLHGFDYVLVPRVSTVGYSEANYCQPTYEYFLTTSAGERRYVGQFATVAPTELEDGYLLWEVYCEGGSPVWFGVARVADDGLIDFLGGTHGNALGLRAEFGSHRVEADGSITFEGTPFGDDTTYTDNFTLSELLEQISD